MWKSGYKTELTFNPNPSYIKSSHHRKCNIIWFNPPFNNQVSTNIGQAFFHLLCKHFPPNHRLCKICNKNNIKLNKSCTPNMGNITAAQNKKLINQHDSPPKTQPCNCRNTNSCPLSGNCREKNIIYPATVRSNNCSLNYFGLCETDFKTRYYNCMHSFRKQSKCKATELSKFVWECKGAGSTPSIHWKLVCCTSSYKQGNDHCNLLSGRKICNSYCRP